MFYFMSLTILTSVATMCAGNQTTRDGAAAARVAHNHEVPGSSPGPATMKNDSSFDGSFFILVAKPQFWDFGNLVGESPRFGR